MSMKCDAVNFLPPGYTARRVRRRMWLTRGTIMLLLFLGLASTSWVVENKRRSLRRQLDVVELTYEDARNRIAQVEQLDRKKQDLERRLSVLADVLKRARGSLVLESIASAVPEHVALTKVEFRMQGGGSAPAVEITVEGRCADHLEVVAFQERLNAEPLMEDVRIVLSEDADAEQETKKFVLTARAKGLLASPPARERS